MARQVMHYGILYNIIFLLLVYIHIQHSFIYMFYVFISKIIKDIKILVNKIMTNN